MIILVNNKNHQIFVKNNIKLSGFFQMKMNNLFFYVLLKVIFIHFIFCSVQKKAS